MRIDTEQSALHKLMAVIGPGMLMAGAAIGVSHLVQSTRAGAQYGYTLLWLVILVNILKYPFFEFGHRFAVATGENLLVGYHRMGKWVLWLFYLLNIITAIGSMAGVTFVTAALAENFFQLGLTNTEWSALLLALCFLMVVIGHYRLVEGVIKVMMVVLFLATLAALVAAGAKGPVASPDMAVPAVSLVFVIALLGWMPAPIELSVWNSLWLQEKQKQLGRKITLREGLFDFNLGYLLTMLLAVAFLSLGALVMFGSGQTLSGSSAAFSSQLVSLYTESIGSLWRPVIAAAAFTAMFSTTLTVFEVYPRSLAVCQVLLLPGLRVREGTQHVVWMLLAGAASLFIINSFLDNLTKLVDLVATIAFLSAPIFALMNYRLLLSKQISEENRPPLWLKLLSLIGLVFLTGFSLFFLYDRFVA